MRKQIVIRPQADADLAGQALFIGADGIDAALRLCAASDCACEQLLEMPGLGAKREFDSAPLEGPRMGPIPDFPYHLIFDRPIETGVEIVRMLHAARDIPHILEGD